MKPDIKVLLKEAQRPQERFVPARAGWNGPEERSAVTTPNPTYDALRAEPTPAQLREEFMGLVMPDWRILLGIAAMIATLRMFMPVKRPRKLAEVLAFPAPAPIAAPAASEAA